MYISIENDIIELIKEFNFFGLAINKAATSSSHVGKIASKLGRPLGVPHKMERPKDALKTIYNSAISP